MKESENNCWGKDISEACIALVKEAKMKKEDIFIIFNNVKIISKVDSDPKQLEEYYLKEVERLSIEYQNSEEYKIQQEKRNQELMETQKKLDESMEKLKYLDCSNQKEVLNWLCEIQPCTDLVGTNVDSNEIVRFFEDNDYFPVVNLGDNFNEDDQDNFARYIIGQCLSQLKERGSFHHILVKFAEDWNKKFN
jgi:hypothetical protein